MNAADATVPEDVEVEELEDLREAYEVLPNDCWFTICLFLPLDDMRRFSYTSQRMRELVLDTVERLFGESFRFFPTELFSGRGFVQYGDLVKSDFDSIQRLYMSVSFGDHPEGKRVFDRRWLELMDEHNRCWESVDKDKREIFTERFQMLQIQLEAARRMAEIVGNSDGIVALDGQIKQCEFFWYPHDSDDPDYSCGKPNCPGCSFPERELYLCLKDVCSYVLSRGKDRVTDDDFGWRGYYDKGYCFFSLLQNCIKRLHATKVAEFIDEFFTRVFVQKYPGKCKKEHEYCNYRCVFLRKEPYTQVVTFEIYEKAFNSRPFILRDFT